MKYGFIPFIAAASIFVTACNGTETIPPQPQGVPDISGVILSEIDGDTDFIELYNTGTGEVSLEGAKVRRMRVKDGKDDEQTLWEGDAACSIAPGEYLCLRYEEGKEGGLFLENKISSRKNADIWLQDASKRKVSEFVRGIKGPGWGLVGMPMCVDDGGEAFSFSFVHGSWVYAQPTPGAANAVKASDIDGTMLYVVINEIDMAGGRIELFNNSDKEIDLLGFQLRWSRIKDNAADNKTVWECTRSTKIAAKGFLVLDAAATGVTALDLSLPKYADKNFHLRLRDNTRTDFTGEPYVYDDIKRGSKGAGWTLETLSSSITGGMVRIPDGTGEWYLSGKSSIGSSNGASPTGAAVPELDAM